MKLSQRAANDRFGSEASFSPRQEADIATTATKQTIQGPASGVMYSA